jgi:hypothetical protein
MAAAVEIGDAVVARLEAGTFSQPIRPRRIWRLDQEPKDLEEALVVVLPAGRTQARTSRSESERDCTIEVGVLKKIATRGDAGEGTDISEVDGLLALVEEMGDWLMDPGAPGLDLAGGGTAGAMALENEPLLNREALEKDGIFSSVIRVTYRMYR